MGNSGLYGWNVSLSRLSKLILFLALLTVLLLAPNSQAAQPIEVNSTLDSVANDGACTLR